MSARRQFMLECGRAVAALVMMGCRADRLMLPECERENPLPPDAVTSSLRDVYIVDGFTGLQLGTKENPYSVRGAAEFDALMRFLLPNDYLAVHYAGRFQTAGVYRWGELASRNLGRGWTVDGDAEISIDPASIADVEGQPLFVLAGAASSVAQLTTIGNHSALADRWKAAGKPLRTGSVLLDIGGSIDRQIAKNFGSLGAETFVREIAGSGAVTNSEFSGFDPSSSDTQVTVNRILGKDAVQEGNRTYASGDNWVQAHCIYQSERGLVRNNESIGARFGYYGDWDSTKGVKILGNSFRGCEHGVQLKLSPTPLPLAASFSHEDYEIGENEIESWGKNVSLDTCGAPTPTRFIRNISVDASLSVESFGAEWHRSACRMAA